MNMLKIVMKTLLIVSARLSDFCSRRTVYFCWRFFTDKEYIVRNLFTSPRIVHQSTYCSFKRIWDTGKRLLNLLRHFIEFFPCIGFHITNLMLRCLGIFTTTNKQKFRPQQKASVLHWTYIRETQNKIQGCYIHNMKRNCMYGWLHDSTEMEQCNCTCGGKTGSLWHILGPIW